MNPQPKPYIVRSWYFDIDDDETVTIYHGPFTLDDAKEKMVSLTDINWNAEVHMVHA